jgi:hypothetical protein
LDYLTTHTSLSPLWHESSPGFLNYKKGCTRLAAASDKVYQLLAHGRWFSPGTPAFSTTKAGCHDIQYSQRHSVINHCDRHITHLSDLDISFVLLNISSKFILHNLECYLLSPKRHIRISKWIKQTKRYISITKKSDTSITVIYHTMSLTVL